MPMSPVLFIKNMIAMLNMNVGGKRGARFLMSKNKGRAGKLQVEF